MTVRLHLRGSRLLLMVAVFFVCGLAGTSDAFSQRLPKATERESENRPTSTVRTERRKKRQITPVVSRTPASAESNNFFDLGERFREQKKFKAAEAAYKEAVKAWSGNVDALIELGFLYLDKNRMDEAEQTYSRLRSLNASYASDLLSEIQRQKNALAH